MSFRATTLRRRILLVLVLGFIPGLGFAQTANLPPTPITFPGYDAVTATLVQAPSTGGSSSSNSDVQWLKVEFHYSVDPPPGTVAFASNFLDEVQFKVWIEGRDQLDPQSKEGEGIAIALVGSVTYVNLPKNKDNYGVVFVHPNTLARYTNKRGVSEFTRTFDVHVEADIDGKPVAAADGKKEQDPKWYQALRAISGLVYRQDQCPFLSYDTDRYPGIKLESR
jgi:hypothetical protein